MTYETDDAMLAKYQIQVGEANTHMGLGEEIVHGAVATVADFASTVWNSTAGMLNEDLTTSTEALLSRIDKDALSVYAEHPDAVHTASMIGGVFVPAGLAMKGMSLLRNGAKGVSWFSKAGEVSRVAKVEQLYKDSLGASEVFNNTKTAMYTAMAANALVDNVAMEGAIVLTMSAHPYMEDYMKDLPSNFLLSAAMGTGISELVGIIGVKAAIRGATEPVAEEVNRIVLKGITREDGTVLSGEMKYAPAGANLGDQVAVNDLNVRNWQGILDEHANPNSTFNLYPLAEAAVKEVIITSKAASIKAFEDMAPSMLEGLPTSLRDSLVELTASDLRFHGANTMSFLNPTKSTGLKGDNGLFAPSWIPKLFTKGTNKAGEEVVDLHKAMYSPTLEAFVPYTSHGNYSVLADYVDSIETLRVKGWKEYGTPRDITLFDRETMNTGEIAKDDAQAFLFYQNKDLSAINRAAFNPDDLAVGKALLARATSLTAEERGKLRVLATKLPPTFGGQVQLTMERAGFSPKYLDGIKQLDKKRRAFMAVDSRGDIIGDMERTDKYISDHSFEALKDWLFEEGSILRQEASNFMGSSHAHGRMGRGSSPIIEDLQSSRSTRTFVDAMRPLADVDGNILLYRGMSTNPKGHATVESFSLSPIKAVGFVGDHPEGLRMYKVHLDDIIASIEDYGHRGAGSNSEILVLNRVTRENAIIPLDNLNHIPEQFFSPVRLPSESDVAKIVTEGAEYLDFAGIQRAVLNAEATMDANLVKLGHSVESRKARAGVSKDGQIGVGQVRYTSEADVLAELNPANKSIVIGTNANKIPFANVRSAMNSNNNTQFEGEVIGAILRSSNDPVIQGLHDLVGNDNMRTTVRLIDEGISRVTQPGLRSSFFRSANSVVENFGTAGVLATSVGKDVTTYINKARTQLIEPINHAMKAIVGKEPLVVETNLALTVNASIEGVRKYEAGQFWKQVKNEETGKMEWEAVTYKGKEFKIQSPEVIALFDTFNPAGRTMYELANVKNKVLGLSPVSDIGFWVPAFNPKDKEVAYVLEQTHGKPSTSILWDKTTAGLNDKIALFKQTAKAEGRTIEILSKDENFEHYNKIKGREDPLAMQAADISMHHSGASASAVIQTNLELMTEIINSYEHYMMKGITNLVDVQMSPIMNKLDMISTMANRLHNEKGMGVIKKGMSKPADPGETMKNILLGKSNLSQHESWRSGQQHLQVYTDMAIERLAKMTAPITQMLSKGAIRNEESFVLLNKELKEKGYMPFEGVAEYHRYINEGNHVIGSLTPRTIALSNSIAATSLLRFMELAQPLINAVSLPILTSGAMRRVMQKEFMGTTLNPEAKFHLHSVMYDGIRAMHNDAFKPLFAMAEEKGLMKAMVSEANAAAVASRSLDPSLTAKAEALVEHAWVKMGSSAADYSETLVRKASFGMGIVLAKKAYPGISDLGAFTYARSFMDEALGNYSSAQRPAIFQGTFGVAMGIFQTYMLTMAQQMYRGIERRDWIGLSQQMLLQGGIFGASSLPGFHVVSEQIGKHFSDQHVDLESGTFRAVPKGLATTLLYGLPSSIGLGLTTRGDIQPRLPNPIQGLDSLVAYNLTKQAMQAGNNIAQAAFSTDGNTGRAFVEALSAQSISRPIARLSEMISGRSVTAAGETIASNTTGNPFAEEFVLHGAFARVFATRPIEEVKARQAIQLNSVYESFDSDNKKRLTKRLKTYIQSGDINPALEDNLREEYLRTGSPSGWRSSVNDALRSKQEGGTYSVKERFHPDSPMQQLVDDLG